jgi:protein phosphatase
MNVEYSGWTDAGMKRDRNEDSYFLDAFNGVFAVFDGMGGARSGEIASQVCVDALAEFGNPEFPKKSPLIEPLLLQALQHVNQVMWDVQKAGGRYAHASFGAAGAAIQVEDDWVTIAHVGDCRVYRLSRGVLTRCTEDHTLLNDPEFTVQIQKLTPEQLKAVPKNVIVRAFGLKEVAGVTCSSLHSESGDLFLVCSDGIHSMLEDDQIRSALENQLKRNSSDIELAVRALVDAANTAGGADNIAAVVVRLT